MQGGKEDQDPGGGPRWRRYLAALIATLIAFLMGEAFVFKPAPGAFTPAEVRLLYGLE